MTLDLFAIAINAISVAANLYVYRVTKFPFCMFVAGVSFFACIALLIGELK